MTGHVLFLNIPALGHLYPTLPIVTELVRRGHKVTYPGVPDRAALLEAAGATVVAYESSRPTDVDPGYRVPDSIAESLLNFLMEAELTLPQWEAVLRADPPDLIVFDRMAFAGGILAAKHGIPAVQLWPQLVTGPQWSWVGQIDPDAPDWLAYQARLGKFLADQGVQTDMLAPEVLRHIAFLPRAFQPHGSRFTPGYEFVGPCLGQRGERWAPPAAKDVLLITLGSLNNMHVDFYQRCFDSFAGTRWHVVMPVGRRLSLDVLGTIPPNFEVLPSVAQLSVLGHAKAFVSHAGLGGVLEAASAGVPQIAIPRTPEQFANAARVDQLGIGVSRPTDLLDAVERVVHDTAMRVAIEHLRLEIAAAGGTIRAADVIEECLSG